MTPPSDGSKGGATFRARIHGDDSFTFTLSYGDLSSHVTQAHIHFGQTSVNGGIAVFLCSNLPSPPAGTAACPESGEVTGTITKAQVIGPSSQGISAEEYDELLDAIRAGVAYVNVHTATFPGGEIRDSSRPGSTTSTDRSGVMSDPLSYPSGRVARGLKPTGPNAPRTP